MASHGSDIVSNSPNRASKRTELTPSATSNVISVERIGSQMQILSDSTSEYVHKVDKVIRKKLNITSLKHLGHDGYDNFVAKREGLRSKVAALQTQQSSIEEQIASLRDTCSIARRTPIWNSLTDDARAFLTKLLDKPVEGLSAYYDTKTRLEQAVEGYNQAHDKKRRELEPGWVYASSRDLSVVGTPAGSSTTRVATDELLEVVQSKLAKQNLG